jgi:hypothetical protein
MVTDCPGASDINEPGNKGHPNAGSSLSPFQSQSGPPHTNSGCPLALTHVSPGYRNPDKEQGFEPRLKHRVVFLIVHLNYIQAITFMQVFTCQTRLLYYVLR